MCRAGAPNAEHASVTEQILKYVISKQYMISEPKWNHTGDITYPLSSTKPFVGVKHAFLSIHFQFM